LTNSLTHNSVFLMPLWRALGAAPGVQQARRIPKWTFAVAAIAIIAIAMCIVPYDFSLGANGQLVPESRSEVYAPLDGVLKEILVSDDPDAIVEQGELLARMTNNDLILEIKTLEGQLKRELEQQKKLDRAGIEQLPRIDQLELRGELSKSLQTEKSIRQKLAIKRHELKKLEIRSPARGQVVNWQLRQNLIRRPVKTGHHLMTVVDPQTEWYLEIEMPERRVEHMMRTLHETSEPLQVTFTLASHPGKTFNGTIVEIDRKLEVHSDEGNAALVRVAFKKDDVPDDLLRTGTRVTAKVHCGKRKVGYVLFHELIETVRSNVLFWF
jgi:multidrug resistance efflux pump